MKFFISADWGTTHLRLRIVDRDRQAVIREVRSTHGIAATYEQWRNSGQAPATRLSFYQEILVREIRRLGDLPQGLPLVVSGMASSSIGMVELPYKAVPFDINGTDLERAVLAASDTFPYRILLISGVRTDEDVMRGEETQLIGCRSAGNGMRLYIVPGTHSKHIYVKEGNAVDFYTYMTGELFHLLSTKSILAASVAAGEGMPALLLPAFRAGVIQGRNADLLHSAFLVRTNQLLGGYSPADNYHYLSGLLIGEELRKIAGETMAVTIVCADGLKEQYLSACQALHITDVHFVDADQALIAGHCLLLGNEFQ